MSLKKVSLLSMCAFSLLAVACSDDGSSDVFYAQGNSTSDLIVSVYDDLPVCSSTREGVTAYVKDDKTAYICQDNVWTVDGEGNGTVSSSSRQSQQESTSSSDDSSADSSSSNVSSSQQASSSSSSGEQPKSSSEGSAASSSSVSNSSVASGSVSSSSVTSSSSAENLSAGVSSSSISSSSVSSSSVSSSTVSSSSTPDEPGPVLTDSRDGQIYKIVKIGEKWWMAENLNYFYRAGTAWSYYYKNDSTYRHKYGVHYSWAAAMDSAGVFSEDGKGCGFRVNCSPKYPVQGVCPEGWHLPDTTEWQALIKEAGGDSLAKIKLKSTSGWEGYKVEGTDDLGFTALPAGRGEGEAWIGEGSLAYFWTSTYFEESFFSFEEETAYCISLNFSASERIMDHWGKYLRLSVRCVKN
ncbi:MAG: fibrobacter succinogenes major paralogous domain-containing protein [Fibrobacter sp.]|nr:fibrobacter succinogenes major paralogous domain-containing protein [Fibrobacter sp.]